MNEKRPPISPRPRINADVSKEAVSNEAIQWLLSNGGFGPQRLAHYLEYGSYYDPAIGLSLAPHYEVISGVFSELLVSTLQDSAGRAAAIPTHKQLYDRLTHCRDVVAERLQEVLPDLNEEQKATLTDLFSKWTVRVNDHMRHKTRETLGFIPPQQER